MNRVAGIGGTEFGNCNLMGYRLFWCLQLNEDSGGLECIFGEKQDPKLYTSRFFLHPFTVLIPPRLRRSAAPVIMFLAYSRPRPPAPVPSDAPVLLLPPRSYVLSHAIEPQRGIHLQRG